ncbi:hypothetical protein I5G59_gp82 [Mycobacterium phage LilMcDreamy]|uniref:Uncharacterized protein n=1 Tax=Mycobacterium phage LilMcDreamy TaxID=2652422 RepID=A0A5P8D8E0_9CAUD|nr:hypothetical protein I5G59_gp82 [Mycobacterium phage LilMcDreamy]QFP94702.1 hypothetical protein SEA_LILMCDREAMY_82 [Mycobacterium phage LilMcDreamy]
MPELIPAEALAVGDLYRGVAFGCEVRGETFKVTAIRTVKTVETYQVIDAINVRTGNRAAINLLRDVTVARLARIDRIHARNVIDGLADGESLHVVRADGALWS